MGRVAIFCAALSVGVLLCVPAHAAQSKHKSHKIPAKQQAPPPQAAAPVAPPTPLTLEHMPATPAQVTYQNSQLTILARNSTVGDILRAVRKQTGANVDAPPNATQRVVGQFGPGSPRDVLASVLDASGFNYVLLGSPANPNGLEHVIITAKSNEPVTNAAVNTPPQPADADTGQNDSSDANDAQEPEQSAPSESFVPQDNPPADDDNSQDQSQNPQIKTPEQLLQELQRQQLLQQQQQQQNQNQGQPGPSEQMHPIQR
ncbi:MAG TPA: hypothetical protein VGG46_09420 [Terriglobales bacterium]